MQEVPFSSLFAYIPKSQRPSMYGVPLEAYQLTIALKQGRETDRLITDLRTSLNSGHFADLFGPDVVMVPAPGHAPRRSQDQFWATLFLVNAIAQALGGEVGSYLQRRKAVNKAAYSRPEDRPTFRTHLNTIACEGPPAGLFTPQRITVVDDVITRGATLAACVYLLKQAYPSAEVRAFAVVRTLRNTTNIARVMNPIDYGRIRIIGDNTHRSP